MKNIHQLIAEAEKLDTPLQETLPVEQASFEVESGQPEEHETEDSVEEMSVPTQSVFTPESAPESPVGSAFTPDDVESPTIDAKTLETQDDPAVVQTREMASYDDFDDLVEGAENSLTDNPEISLETKSFQSQETPASQNEKLLLTRDTSDYGEDSYNENEIHDEPEQPEIDITNDVETPETPETETSTLGEIPDTEQPTIEFEDVEQPEQDQTGFQGFKDAVVTEEQLADMDSQEGSENPYTEQRFEFQQRVNADFVQQLADELGPTFDDMRDQQTMAVHEYVAHQQLLSILLRE